MTKYYNKDIPTEIHFVYGGRHSGKTYREYEKLKTRINEFEEEHKRDYDLLIERHNKLFNDYKELEEENNQYKEYIKELKDSLMNYHIKNNKLIIYKSRINKALKFIDGMFDDGDGDKIIDNLLKLEEILKGEKNDN